MKIRTITTGITLTSPQSTDKIKQAHEFNQQAKEIFEEQGYEVQTTRITTNSWEEYLLNLSKIDILHEIQNLEKICQSLDINFFNIGYANQPETIALIPDIIKSTAIIYCSSQIGNRGTGINFPNAWESAKTIKRISEESENGYGNFRYCVWANCQPGIPFFPTAYHVGDTSFGIGLELGELVMQAFSQAGNLQSAEKELQSILEIELIKVAKIAEGIALKFGVKYNGIDTSLAPSLDQENSIAFAYEKIMSGKFGHPGTLAISGMLTRVLKSVSVKICGYSGLMLPVCEDVGLATRANEQTYDLTHLLLYSAVCGCGLDTVPIPGDITVDKIAAILIDLSTLAIKLNKPLSARLFPIPNKQAGEMTSFSSPYLVDCHVFAVD
ncbi:MULTISPECIES: DUF711 family protein [unclassified Nodularia (in: cyanobacteria)]|uniref:DUF711 family protein n=1 Tax=unclassified Nodularia (in: cyanobacteria) TaxID=2656917 RepID=UPI00187F1E76|nr:MULTISPECIES: DUF711 family protein [unclassified Nodularia (in: cyanobacteria)]MBE9198503.1 DUF711 family protein [Nodularia sp. LEGE 06071]MCC2691032.1 DUF711 family protein [Nodularia sp. LEGE 04288]